MGRNHVLVGAVGWLAAAGPVTGALGHPLAPRELAAGTVLAAGAALLPDIDHPGSTVSRTLGPITGLTAKMVAKLTGGHRGATHSLAFAVIAGGAAHATVQVFGPAAVFGWMLVCASWALRLLGPSEVNNALFGLGVPVAAAGIAWVVSDTVPAGWWVTAAVAGGYVLHLAGDVVTKGPMPLLWPSSWRFSTNLIRTDGTVEHVLSFVLAVAVVALAWPLVDGMVGAT